MELETLYALRSPSGVPSPPVLFLVLLVLTWALHILAVYVMLGSVTLSLVGAWIAHPNWRRLSSAMLDTAKVAVSMAIVLGVAPLLFVQVIYDPFWYVSNVLSARWVLAFVMLLLTAYYALYHRYFAGRDGGQAGRLSLAVALVLLLAAGFIMHVLTHQMLRPELWLHWYAPDGHIDASGSGLHDFNIGRFLYFLTLALPVTGAWLSGYSYYLAQRPQEDRAYLQWLRVLSGRAMSVGGLVALLCYALWMSTLPDAAKSFGTSLWSVLAVVATLALAIAPALFKVQPADCRPALLAAAAIVAIAAAREALRIGILKVATGTICSPTR